MSYKCPSNNEVTFKIIIWSIICLIVILKATSLFDKHLMDIYMTRRITLGNLKWKTSPLQNRVWRYIFYLKRNSPLSFFFKTKSTDWRLFPCFSRFFPYFSSTRYPIRLCKNCISMSLFLFKHISDIQLNLQNMFYIQANFIRELA
jgi:hypothetical protein